MKKRVTVGVFRSLSFVRWIEFSGRSTRIHVSRIYLRRFEVASVPAHAGFGWYYVAHKVVKK